MPGNPEKPVAKMIASACGIGYSPILPGTLASLAALFLSLPLLDQPPLFLVVLGILGIVGFVSSRVALQATQEKDPSWIVMDEVVGMMISLFLIPPKIPYLVLCFVLFRFFDSVKVFPLDRLEKIKGPWGVFLDDVGAGIYTNILLRFLVRFF
ncbi:MAG: phosphatidylglycerophosphatase A [Candidatus Omnitrophota bacterium]